MNSLRTENRKQDSRVQIRNYKTELLRYVQWSYKRILYLLHLEGEKYA